MSGAISGVNAVGQLVTRDSVFRSNNIDQILADNGVTDKALFMKGDVIGQPLDFLDSLTPDQLKETTIASIGSGTRVTTYGDLKLFRHLQQGLEDQSDLLLRGGSMIGSSRMTADNMKGTDVQALQVVHLFADLQADKPGCITAAEDYLAGKLQLPTTTPDAALAQMKADDAYGAYGASLGVDWVSAGQAALTLLKTV